MLQGSLNLNLYTWTWFLPDPELVGAPGSPPARLVGLVLRHPVPGSTPGVAYPKSHDSFFSTRIPCLITASTHLKA